MPIYNYTCRDCNEEQQQIHKWDEGHAPCLECGSVNLKKSVAMPAKPRFDGREGMSVRHTTSEYFGTEGHMGKDEYFPEERSRKAKEYAKKQASKGATVSVKKSNSTSKV